MKKLLSIITIMAMLLLVVPTVSLAAEVTKFTEDFSQGYTVDDEIQKYSNWIYYEAGTGAKNGNMTVAEETDGNIAALLEHKVKGTNGVSKNLTYAMSLPQQYEGIVTISFKTKTGTDNASQFKFFVYDSVNAQTRGNEVMRLIHGISSGAKIQVMYPNNTASNAPSNTTEPKAGEWAQQKIVINTYTGDLTVYTLDGFTNKVTRVITNTTESPTGIKGMKIGAFAFNIGRDTDPNTVMIDDIIVKEDKINIESEFGWDKVSAESTDSITSNLTLPTSFSTHGVNYTVTWNSDNDAINHETGAVSQKQSDTNVKLTATFTTEDEALNTSKEFNVVVKKFDVLSNLTFASINPGVKQGSLTGNINLPTSYTANGMQYDLAWTSSKPDYISNDGKVVRTAFDTPVTLSAVISANGEEIGAKKFDVNVAAENTTKFFSDDLTGTTLGTLTQFVANTTDDWSVASTNATAMAMQYPSIVGAPDDSSNEVLKVTRTKARVATDSSTNHMSQVYRRVDGLTAGGTKYVSFNIYRTNTTSRIDMRVMGTNGTRIATVGIEGSTGKLRNITNNLGGFTDNRENNCSVPVDTWVNITLKIDFDNKKTEAYVDGNYAGIATMYYNVADADKSTEIGYVTFDNERFGNNQGAAYSVENPGYFYIDDISVRDAADDAYGVVSVTKADDKITDITFRKINNIGEASKMFVAVYENGTDLTTLKVVNVATGNDTGSIFKAEGLDINCPAGSVVKVFNFSGSLAPLSAVFNE